jgi:ribosomal protein S11
MPSSNDGHTSRRLRSLRWTKYTDNHVPTGELVFGVARIFASFNDTFVHVTDLSYVSE